MSLKDIAKRMVQPQKGILAADESTRTIIKRFATIGKEANEMNRAHYRGTVFMSDGIEKYISGVILYDETARTPRHQAWCAGQSVVEHLLELDIVPGIKVDKGTKVFANHYQITEGLDSLRERLQEYSNMGLQFAKWRAVIDHLSPTNFPERFAIKANAHSLARYARLCQEEGLVPIVEPEVLLDNSASIGRIQTATELTLKIVFDELYEQGVDFEAMILKPNMVMNGYALGNRSSPEEVASHTIEVLRDTVPASVPGIAFLSGGQLEAEATTNLGAIHKLAKASNCPWAITFSFGRALQESALAAWAANTNFETFALCKEAQEAFLYRAQLNSMAIS